MAQRDMLEEWNCEKSHDEHYRSFRYRDRDLGDRVKKVVKRAQ